MPPKSDSGLAPLPTPAPKKTVPVKKTLKKPPNLHEVPFLSILFYSVLASVIMCIPFKGIHWLFSNGYFFPSIVLRSPDKGLVSIVLMSIMGAFTAFPMGLLSTILSQLLTEQPMLGGIVLDPATSVSCITTSVVSSVAITLIGCIWYEKTTFLGLFEMNFLIAMPCAAIIAVMFETVKLRLRVRVVGKPLPSKSISPDVNTKQQQHPPVEEKSDTAKKND